MKISILGALTVMALGVAGVAGAQETPTRGKKSVGVLTKGVFHAIELLTVEEDTQRLFGKVLAAEMKGLSDKWKNKTISATERIKLNGYCGWVRDWNQYLFLDRIARGDATTADDIQRQEKYGIFVRRARVDDQSRIDFDGTTIDPQFALVSGEWLTSQSIALDDEALVVLDGKYEMMKIETLMERRRGLQQLLDSYAHAYFNRYLPETMEEVLKALEK